MATQQTAPTTTNNTGTTITLKQELQSSTFIKMLTENDAFKMDMARESAFAVQVIEKNEQLQRCTPDSFKNCLLSVALTGLTLNPVLQQADLIPRMVKGKLIAVLEPTYKGLITKMNDFGVSVDVFANVVFANDIYDYEQFTNTVKEHKPWWKNGAKESGEEICVYGCILRPDGSRMYRELPITRINDIMKMSESYKASKRAQNEKDRWESIWEGVNRNEMICKTMIKYMWKFIPKSSRMETLGRIIEESNFAHEMTDTTITENGDDIKTKSPGQAQNRVDHANSKMKPIIPKNNRKVAEAEIVPENPPVEEIKGTDNTTSLAKEVTTDTVVIDPNAKDEILSAFSENYSLGDRSTRTSGEVTEMFEILDERGFKRELIEERVAKGSKSFKTAEELLLKGTEEQIGAVLGKILEVQAAQQQELFSQGK